MGFENPPTGLVLPGWFYLWVTNVILVCSPVPEFIVGAQAKPIIFSLIMYKASGGHLSKNKYRHMFHPGVSRLRLS